MNRRAGIIFTIVALAFPVSVLAQAYPNRYVTLVVGFTAGGAADIVGRTLAAELTKVLGQQVVVENRAGAGGIIAAESVVRSAPNGYTLLVGGPGPNAIAPSLYAKLAYDPVKDFAPISAISENPNALIVHPSVPARDSADLIRLARAKPGDISYASAGNGSSQHLAAELFRSLAKITILHVPHKGVPEGINGVLSGQVELMFPPIFNAIPLARAGKLKILGITSSKRSPVLPDAPTIAESGLPGYEQISWNALFAPAATPPAIIARLNEATRSALATKDARSKLESLGATPYASTPEELGEFIKKEIAKWGKVVKESGMTVN